MMKILLLMMGVLNANINVMTNAYLVFMVNVYLVTLLMVGF